MKRKISTPTAFGSTAPKLVANGYRVLPIDAVDRKRPEPKVGNWRGYEFAEEDATRYADDGVGILCGLVRAVDIDVRNAALAAQIEALVTDKLGAAPRRIGDAPKSLYLYRAAEAGPKITGLFWKLPGDEKGAKPHRIEVLGEGQQFVAYGVHRDTERPYVWNGAGDPLSVAADALPLVTEQQLREFVHAADALLAKHGKRAGRVTVDFDRRRKDTSQLVASSFQELLSAFAAIPYDAEYEGWYRNGLAFHRACGRRADSAEARDAWLAHCAKHPEDEPAESLKKWQSFFSAATPDNALGKNTIFALAHEAGWKLGGKKPKGDPPDLSQLVLPTAAEIAALKLEPKVPLFAGLLHPGAWLATGRPKIGKSWVLLQLAFAVAHGRPFLDYVSTGARGVLYIAAEDDNARLQERFAILKQAPPPSMRVINRELLFTLAEQYAAHLGLAEFIANYHDANPDIGLVILDTETVCRQVWEAQRESDGQPRRGRATEEDYRQTREFDEVAQPREFVLVLTNHAGKRKNGEWGDIHELINRTGTAAAGVTGSIAMSDPPDVSQLDGPQRERILGIRGRDQKEDILLVIEQSDDATFQVLGTYSEVKQTRIEDQLLHAVLELRDESQPEVFVRTRDIANHLEMRATNVKRAISRMVKADRVTWRGWGVEVKRGAKGGVRLLAIAGRPRRK